MPIFKCKMCGGNLDVIGDEKVIECEYCGSKQTIPNADNEKKINLFNRANRLRMACEFDKAAGIYEQIIAEFPEEAEAYWGLCLANYGIEYVDDPATGNKIPTCHRASFDKMRRDENYELAVENADMAARLVYAEQAKEIDRIMGEILTVSRDEKPYDIFICYKETDASGNRTPDSVLAQDIYDTLTEKGYRVFFSRITLEDKLGTQYEPYIFAALNSAKMMLVIGTDYEYMNAVWVKNEWSRFIKLIGKDKTKVLIPCYKDMDPYDMPDEFKPYQSLDCGKLGFMQDLARGIDKIFGKTEPKKNSADGTASSQNDGNATTASLLERAFIFLEDGKWQKANSYFEKVLDIAPKNAEAYLGKLLSELNVHTESELKDCDERFDDHDNYIKAVRFGDEQLRTRLENYSSIIRERLDNARSLAEQTANNNAYNSALALMEAGRFMTAANAFRTIDFWKDAKAKADECLQKQKEFEANKDTKKKKLRDLSSQITSAEAELKVVAAKLTELIGYQSDTQKSAYNDACRKVDAAIESKMQERKMRISSFYASQIEAIASELNFELQAVISSRKQITAQISSLQSRRSSLGLFKGREKQALQEQIDALQRKMSSLSTEEAIRASYQPQIDAIKQKEAGELQSIESSLREDNPYPQFEDFADIDNPYRDDISELEQKRKELSDSLDALKDEHKRLGATVGGFGHGIDLNAIENDLNAPQFRPSMKEIYSLALKLGKIYSEAFKDSEYDIDYLVEAKEIDENADKDAYPVHFLFSKNGEPVLAVVCCTTMGYKRPRVVLTQMLCKEHNIKYIRYFCDGGYPNEADYVIGRTKAALNGK